jgi:hypothetical protein
VFNESHYKSESTATNLCIIDRIKNDDWGDNFELKEGWKLVGGMHKEVCEQVIGVSGTVANGGCIRELGRMNRKEKLLERVVKYWLRLCEIMD